MAEEKEQTRPDGMTPSFPVISGIARVTFLEIVRDKILYTSVVFSFFLLAIGFLASRLTFVRPERVVADFGLSAVSLSCALIAVILGASLLPREIGRRTFLVALSRPISRHQFVAGKFLGLSAVLVVNWLMLSSAFLVILSVTGEGVQAYFHPTLAIALLFSALQCVLLASLAIFFSSFSTTSLAAMITIGLYLIGNNLSQLRIVATKVRSPLGSGLLNALSFALPDLEHFNLASKVTYSLPVSWAFGGTSLAYFAAVTGLCLLLAGLFLSLREI